jgi:hypothetical protein
LSNVPAFLTRSPRANFLLLMLTILTLSLTTQAQVGLTKISRDPFTNSTSQHATEVEPATFAAGNTIVSVFQMGRFVNNGGASDNGWATSLDGGTTWQHGVLPGLTVYHGGTYERVSDAAITYDAAHGVWLAASLPVSSTGVPLTAMLVNSSPDGITWANPVPVSPKFNKPDKTWLNCDDNTTSPYYGHCYAEWDDNSALDTIYFSVSSDGGKTWGTPVLPAGAPIGLGLQPLAQPGGTVIAPGVDAFLTTILSVTSTDGGTSWGSAVTISSLTYHVVAGSLRDLVLPSSAMDASGKVYAVWQDCRFRSGCTSNDLVMSTSTDGSTWTAVQRIPVDPVTSGYDHFIPGLAIEPGTSGTTAHLGLTFYFYPQTNCTTSTCKLEEGYISSSDGGTTWTSPTRLTGSMQLSWLANTNLGWMVGDYESLAFVSGKAHPVFALARPNSGTVFNEVMVTPTTGLVEDLALYTSEGDKPVPNAHSDHLTRTTPVCDNCEDRD